MKRPEIVEEEDEGPANYEPLSDAEFEALSPTAPPPAPGTGERAFGTIILVLVLAAVGIAVAWVAVDYPDRADHPAYWWWAIPVSLASALALGFAIRFRAKIDEPVPHPELHDGTEEGSSHPTRPHPLDAVAWFFLACYAGTAAYFDAHLVFRLIAGLASAYFAVKSYLLVEELRERHTWAPLDKRRTARDAALVCLPILLHARWISVDALLPAAEVIFPVTAIFALWLRRELESNPPSLH